MSKMTNNEELQKELKRKQEEKRAELQRMQEERIPIPTGQRRTNTPQDVRDYMREHAPRKGAYKTDVEATDEVPDELAEDNAELVFSGSYAAKPKRKLGKSKIDYDDDTNTRITAMMMRIVDLPAIDLNDENQIEMRCRDYLSICYEYQDRPTTEGLSCALGIDRTTLLNWITGRRTKKPEVVEVLKKYHSILNGLMASYMTNNKISPITGVFLSRNNFPGYTDAGLQITVTNQPQTPDVLEQKYMESIAELKSAEKAESEDGE